MRLASPRISATFALRRMNQFRFFIIWAAAVSVFLQSHVPARAQAGDMLPLAEGWRIQSAGPLAQDAPVPGGAAISSTGFAAADWYPAAVPTTVLGALVNDGVYTNVFYGTNLALIPRTQFTGPWWFRNTFSVTAEQASENSDLIFDGINYRANIWLNGRLIATNNNIFGAFRIFKLDVSGNIKPGENTLAVEVFPPRPGDFTMGFVDWNPAPPDRGMGLFRPVNLHFHGPVAMDHVFVTSRIDHAGWRKAALTIHADLSNASDKSVDTTINGECGGASFSEKFLLAPRQTRSVALTPARNPALNLGHAQLWWPWELGQPHLYDLKLAARADGRISDRAETRFGIREVTDYLTPEGYRGYRINGKKILLRGGGWADELFLRENATNLDAQIRYARAMNLNTIRLEGIWGESQRLYDTADEYGMLIMAGWSCQWEWSGQLGKDCDDFGGIKSEADMDLATNYLRDQVLWLRNHPSIFLWVLGSDKLPRPELERRYDALLKTMDPTRPTLKTCGDAASAVSGPSGVKMNGPYDYVTPDYWYLDTKNGGAFGFNTETGPGMQPPPLESLQRMIPAADLWPINPFWNFHCARGQFRRMDPYYMDAFTNRYGMPHGAVDFAFKSQAANYEAIRPMYEAFAARLPHTTGIIQWMLNPSWPKLYWQLYDYYLVPGGAFFGAKKGAAPFAVIYDYGNRGIYLVNQTYRNPGPCRTTVAVYDLESNKILEHTVTNGCAAYGSEKIFDLSALSPKTSVYFLDLQTTSENGMTAGNFYWLSTKPDVLDEDKTTWFVTPNKSFADFTALDRLRPARVNASVSFDATGTAATVTLKNTGRWLAFFIQMRMVDAETQRSLTPVFWDDNYVSLPPHAVRVFHVRFPRDEKPELKLKGWNVRFVLRDSDRLFW